MLIQDLKRCDTDMQIFRVGNMDSPIIRIVSCRNILDTSWRLQNMCHNCVAMFLLCRVVLVSIQHTCRSPDCKTGFSLPALFRSSFHRWNKASSSREFLYESHCEIIITCLQTFSFSFLATWNINNYYFSPMGNVTGRTLILGFRSHFEHGVLNKRWRFLKKMQVVWGAV